MASLFFSFLLSVKSMTNAAIVVRPGDNFEWVLKGFTRAVQKAEVHKELSKRAHFRPKSEKRRSKRNRALARRVTSDSKRLKAERRYGPGVYD
jgi:ribosomal protein S21